MVLNVGTTIKLFFSKEFVHFQKLLTLISRIFKTFWEWAFVDSSLCPPAVTRLVG